MTTTMTGTLDAAMMERQIRRAAEVGRLGFEPDLKQRDSDSADFREIAVWSARAALESAYRRGFADAEDAIAADAAPSTSAEPDSPDTTDQLMSRAYAAAADKLAAAAKALADAAEAARIGQRNLAIGTAMGAEADAARAKALTYAISRI